MNIDMKSMPCCHAMREAGDWNADWEAMAQLQPEWTERFMQMIQPSMDPAVLDPKIFELVCIAIDASVTHMYAPGTRRHIRRALEIGVKPQEILAVLQLTASLGLHTMSLAAPMLREELQRQESKHKHDAVSAVQGESAASTSLET